MLEDSCALLEELAVGEGGVLVEVTVPHELGAVLQDASPHVRVTHGRGSRLSFHAGESSLGNVIKEPFVGWLSPDCPPEVPVDRACGLLLLAAAADALAETVPIASFWQYHSVRSLLLCIEQQSPGTRWIFSCVDTLEKTVLVSLGVFDRLVWATPQVVDMSRPYPHVSPPMEGVGRDLSWGINSTFVLRGGLQLCVNACRRPSFARDDRIIERLEGVPVGLTVTRTIAKLLERFLRLEQATRGMERCSEEGGFWDDLSGPGTGLAWTDPVESLCWEDLHAPPWAVVGTDGVTVQEVQDRRLSPTGEAIHPSLLWVDSVRRLTAAALTVLLKTVGEVIELPFGRETVAGLSDVLDDHRSSSKRRIHRDMLVRSREKLAPVVSTVECKRLSPFSRRKLEAALILGSIGHRAASKRLGEWMVDSLYRWLSLVHRRAKTAFLDRLASTDTHLIGLSSQERDGLGDLLNVFMHLTDNNRAGSVALAFSSAVDIAIAILEAPDWALQRFTMSAREGAPEGDDGDEDVTTGEGVARDDDDDEVVPSISHSGWIQLHSLFQFALFTVSNTSQIPDTRRLLVPALGTIRVLLDTPRRTVTLDASIGERIMNADPQGYDDYVIQLASIIGCLGAVEHGHVSTEVQQPVANLLVDRIHTVLRDRIVHTSVEEIAMVVWALSGNEHNKNRFVRARAQDVLLSLVEQEHAPVIARIYATCALMRLATPPMESTELVDEAFRERVEALRDADSEMRLLVVRALCSQELDLFDPNPEEENEGHFSDLDDEMPSSPPSLSLMSPSLGRVSPREEELSTTLSRSASSGRVTRAELRRIARSGSDFEDSLQNLRSSIERALFMLGVDLNHYNNATMETLLLDEDDGFGDEKEAASSVEARKKPGDPTMHQQASTESTRRAVIRQVDIAQNVPPSLPQDSSGHDIMISYAWREPLSHTPVRVASDLRDRGYRVWLDRWHMKDDLVRAMTEAVTKAKVIIVFMSAAYVDSPACELEANLAWRLRKLVIPVFLEPFATESWLGALFGGKLYIPLPRDGSDPSTQSMYEQKFTDLCARLASEIGSPAASSPPASSAKAAAIVPRAPKPEFESCHTSSEVERVLEKHGSLQVTRGPLPTDIDAGALKMVLELWQSDRATCAAMLVHGHLLPGLKGAAALSVVSAAKAATQ
jgi:hypothetical protein